MGEESGSTGTPVEAPKGAEPEGADALGDPGKRALDAERANARNAQREAAELRAKLQEHEDKGKSEAEKHSRRADEAQKRAEAAEAKVLRFEIADELGVKPAHRKYLSGNTEDELRASAKDIKTDFADAYRDTPKPGSTRPVESLRPGQVGQQQQENPDAWLRSLAGRNR